MSPENLLSMGISWSSALLWIVWPSANILRLLLEKMSRRQQHFFIHSSYSHGNISLCVIPKSGCKWEQNETQVVTKSIACLLFDLFFRWNFIFLRLSTPLQLFHGNSSTFLSTDTWRNSAVVIARGIFWNLLSTCPLIQEVHVDYELHRNLWV